MLCYQLFSFGFEHLIFGLTSVSWRS